MLNEQGPYGGGHYVAYVLDETGFWNVANDTSLTLGLEFEPVKCSIATTCYLAFYAP